MTPLPIIGAVYPGMGYSTAVGETGGSIVGATVGGGIAGGLNAAYYGGNVEDGILQGAKYGAISMGVAEGLRGAGLYSPLAAAAGGYAAGGEQGAMYALAADMAPHILKGLNPIKAKELSDRAFRNEKETIQDENGNYVKNPDYNGQKAHPRSKWDYGHYVGDPVVAGIFMTFVEVFIQGPYYTLPFTDSQYRPVIKAKAYWKDSYSDVVNTVEGAMDPYGGNPYVR